MIMKKAYSFIFLAAFWGMPLSGFTQFKNEFRLKKAVENLYEAMVNADSTTMSKMVSGSLLYVHSSGIVDYKDEFISRIMSGASDFVKIETSEAFFNISGKVAIVRHVLSAKTNDGGKPGAVQLLIMQVWQRKGGRWILLARQASKMN